MATVLVALTIATGACGGSSSTAGLEDDGVRLEPVDATDDGEVVEITPPATEPATAWQALTESTSIADGVDVDVALQAFALAFGDLPGVEPPSVPSGEIGAPSGTQALWWLSAHADEVTDEQLAAVEAALAPTTPAPTEVDSLTAPPRGKSARTARARSSEVSCTIQGELVDGDAENTEEYRAIVDEELPKVEAALGQSLGIPIYLTLRAARTDYRAWAWTSPQSPDCVNDLATSCHIGLLVNNLDALPDADVHYVIAHEIVHCFQSRWLPPYQALSAPSWLVEGFADFLGEQLNPGSAKLNLGAYFLASAKPLFDRSYDAQGFYFRLDEVGADPAGRYETAFRASPDNLAAFRILTDPPGTAFSESWASSMALQPERGPAWVMQDASPDQTVSIGTGTATNHARLVMNAGQATTKMAHIDFQADVVTIGVTGAPNGRVSWDGFDEELLSTITGTTFCGLAGGCECPDGSPGPADSLPSSGALVSLAGMADAASLDIVGLSLDDWCQPPPPIVGSTSNTSTDVVDSCLVGSWATLPWTLPGPMPGMDAVGGDDAFVDIAADGNVGWDFDEMVPMVSEDAQLGSVMAQETIGAASGTATATGGTWTADVDPSGLQGRLTTEIAGSSRELPLEGGPGLLVLLRDGSYVCNGEDFFTFTTDDPVENTTISIDFVRVGA